MGEKNKGEENEGEEREGEGNEGEENEEENKGKVREEGIKKHLKIFKDLNYLGKQP